MTGSSQPPLVTVVVPARDEEPWIIECLSSIVDQDYPLDRIEVVIVIDGSCRDRTEVVAKEFLSGIDVAGYDVVRNPSGGTPGNLNVGLARAHGEVLCRVDARSRIPENYVRRCVELLMARAEVAVVGGAQTAVASRADALGTGIARALNNRWGMGLSRYRRGAASGPADTVYLGAFRTRDLRAAGGWSLDFPTNQDFELNRRMSTRGLVWFDADLSVAYIPRLDLSSLHAQYARFGSWKVRYWRKTGDRPRPRQLALLVGVPVMGAGAVATFAAASGRTRVGMAVAGIAAIAFVEARGSRTPRGGLRAHAWSAVALAAVGTGWLRGAWVELVRRAPQP